MARREGSISTTTYRHWLIYTSAISDNHVTCLKHIGSHASNVKSTSALDASDELLDNDVILSEDNLLLFVN